MRPNTGNPKRPKNLLTSHVMSVFNIARVKNNLIQPSDNTKSAVTRPLSSKLTIEATS